MDGRQSLSNSEEYVPREDGRYTDNSDAQIIHLMVEYMQEFLEKPHPVFGGLPICPFARKARLENRILYKVVHSWDCKNLNPDSLVMRAINEFRQDGNYEVLLVIHPDKAAMTQPQLQQFIDILNQKISAVDLVAFGGHPSDEFNIQGIYTRQEPYLNFTVQTKQLVKEASDLLLKTAYYNNWTQDNLNYIGLPRGE